MQYSLFITCPKGLSDLLAEELVGFGLKVVKQTVAGIYVTGDLRAVYTTILWSRLANRVLLYLFDGEIQSQQQLYQLCYQYNWTELFNPNSTLCIDFTGESAVINNSMFGAQCIKDAIVDQIREITGSRPNIDRIQPDVRVNALLKNNILTISLDLVGQSLHHRGYRQRNCEAPLKENVAAALLYRAKWPQRVLEGQTLIDPCCGSGTILIEAALMASQFAPGLMLKKISINHWRSHDVKLWQELRQQAQQQHQQALKTVNANIIGYDNDFYAIEATRYNARLAGMQSYIQLKQQELADFILPTTDEKPVVIVTNPPYGERLSEVTELTDLYQQLGNALAKLPGQSLAAVLTAHDSLAKAIGLYSHKQNVFFNGPIECKLYQYLIRDNCQPKNVQTQELSAAAAMLYNRLFKNQKHLAKWLTKNNITNYRLYDADIPEYAFAIDIYDQQWAHIQEYMPPASIDSQKAEQRLLDVLQVLPRVLNIAASNIILKQRQRQKGKAQYQRQNTLHKQLIVSEDKAKFGVNLYDFIDTGLFLDHRPLRLMMAAQAYGKTFLNLFCYTATVSVHAALAGARKTTNVDMSHTYLDWAENNFILNRIEVGKHEFIQADCLQWLANCKNKYDLILLDPPSFSNSKRMDTTLDIQRDHVQLIENTMKLLMPSGILYFSNNFKKFKLDQTLIEIFEVTNITSQTIAKDFENSGNIHHCFVIRHKALDASP